MARGKGKQKQGKEPSLRDNIKAYRRSLHGEIAIAFDRKFIELTGEKDLKKALTNGKNLQSAFVAAKAAADAERKLHPIVDVPDLPDEDDDE